MRAMPGFHRNEKGPAHREVRWGRVVHLKAPGSAASERRDAMSNMETHPDRARVPSGCSLESLAKRRRQHKATRPQLVTRAQLDGRTSAAKAFDKLVANIEADLGGRDQLSTIELVLIEAFAGATVTLQHLNTRLALGQEIDLGQYAQTVSAMVRVASRLGLRRRARDVTPSLSDLLREDQARQQAAANCGVADG
jgi:hypothetical protein